MKAPSKQRQVEIIKELAELVDEMGWVIALPTEEETVPGLIIGTEEFAKNVVQAYYGDKVEFLGSNESGDFESLSETDSGVPELPIAKKRATWH